LLKHIAIFKNSPKRMTPWHANWTYTFKTWHAIRTDPCKTWHAIRTFQFMFIFWHVIRTHRFGLLVTSPCCICGLSAEGSSYVYGTFKQVYFIRVCTFIVICIKYNEIIKHGHLYVCTWTTWYGC
jgi:hypothetical protein